ncbi:thioesterase II [Auriscalpium vulgare]|uniref:Thioesterase II n=1 Tax=Auriscalpium vulgare TaxID=40419 RepID=A0ACB8S2C5_9AGAM|nr:thioesterase II [Auriscalpium vulgare]
MTDAINDHDQAETSRISTSLDVEQLDTNLFRSLRLFIPFRSRGVFGGQVVSQALVAATKCVDPAYKLHSLHAYFLLSASATVPMLYYVERLRDGKSYATRCVRAVQRGQTVYVMLCSFHTPEPWQPTHQWPIPRVPPPDQSPEDIDILRARARAPGVPPAAVQWFEEYAQARLSSPIAVRHPGHVVAADGTRTFLYWMKLREDADYSAPYQKCILAYLSDLHFIHSVTLTLGLKPKGRAHGKEALRMISSLDHNLTFYEHEFTCNDWILYVMNSPASGSGRGFVTGRLYSREGRLIAVANQEGAVRADVRDPDKDRPASSKL